MPYAAGGAKKPSEQLHDLLSGSVSVEDTPPAILSWAQFEIYRAAVQILDINTKERRRLALKKIPDQIRPYVEREAKNLFYKRLKEK